MGVADLVNGAVVNEGEEVLPTDVVIVAVTIQDALGNAVTSDASYGVEELSLLVEYSTKVAVGGGELSSRRRRRNLSSSGGSALSLRTDEVSEIIAASAVDGRMAESLSAASASSNANLSTDVTGLVGDISTSTLTPDVDVEAAYAAAILSEKDKLQRLSMEMQTSLNVVQDDLTVAGGGAEEWTATLLKIWEDAQELDFENVEALSLSIDEIIAKLEQITSQYELVNSAAAEAQLALQETLDAVERLVSENVVDSLEVQLQPPPYPPPAPPLWCGFVAQTNAERVRLATEIQYEFVVPAPHEARRHLLKRVSGGAGGSDDDASRWELPKGSAVNDLKSMPSEVPGRYITMQHNKLFAGLLFAVTRGTVLAGRECTSRFEHLAAPCVTKSAHSRHYGIDPVFRPTSSLFRSDLQHERGTYYNTSQGSEDIHPDTGAPRPFRPRHIPGRDDSQPFFISAEVGAYRAQQLYTFLEEGLLIDSLVNKVDVSVVTFNSQLQAWCVVAIGWVREHGNGYWTVQSEIYPSPVTYWGVGSARDILWMLMHVVWVLVSVTIFVQSALLLRPRALPAKYNQAHYLVNLMAHLSDVENLLALCGAVLQIWVVVMFFSYHFRMLTLTVSNPQRIYHDLYWNANYFLSSREPDDAASGAAEAEAGGALTPAWALPEDNLDFERFTMDAQKMASLGQLNQAFFLCQTARVLILILRLLLTSAHQKHLAVVINTCRDSLRELLQCFPFFLSAVCFTFLFHIQLGMRLPQLRTMQKSADVVAKFALLGEYEILRNPSWESTMLEAYFKQASITIFIFLYYFFLNNFILAIVCDNMYKLWKASLAEQTLAQDAVAFYQNRINVEVKKKWPSLERTIDMLSLYHHGLSLQECREKSKEPRMNLAMVMSGTAQLFNQEHEDAPSVSVHNRVYDSAKLLRVLNTCLDSDQINFVLPRNTRDAHRQHSLLLDRDKVGMEEAKGTSVSAEGESASPTSTETERLKAQKQIFRALAHRVITEISSLQNLNRDKPRPLDATRSSKRRCAPVLRQLVPLVGHYFKCNSQFYGQLESRLGQVNKCLERIEVNKEHRAAFSQSIIGPQGPKRDVAERKGLYLPLGESNFVEDFLIALWEISQSSQPVIPPCSFMDVSPKAPLLLSKWAPWFSFPTSDSGLAGNQGQSSFGMFLSLLEITSVHIAFSTPVSFSLLLVTFFSGSTFTNH
ncbi:TRP-like ion channel Pkd2 [Cymbomonas tetramitiformis]|uniref:TRP-like ion channel Pkd2 n=1 Tax=Cymbomonas tetramitiformis TaxID=36881 RepID=A0AAE0GF86_9CHLO|nr:TRP-like ion channel Pkd2 [Cymbomonas tetramitiformis]